MGPGLEQGMRCEGGDWAWGCGGAIMWCWCGEPGCCWKCWVWGCGCCGPPPICCVCGEYTSCLTFCSSSPMLYVSSVSSNPVADIRWSPPTPEGGGSGELRHVWMRALPASDVIIGCSFRVANVYTWPVSDATSSITWVPVSVDSSYACQQQFLLTSDLEMREGYWGGTYTPRNQVFSRTLLLLWDVQRRDGKATNKKSLLKEATVTLYMPLCVIKYK